MLNSTLCNKNVGAVVGGVVGVLVLLVTVAFARLRWHDRTISSGFFSGAEQIDVRNSNFTLNYVVQLLNTSHPAFADASTIVTP